MDMSPPSEIIESLQEFVGANLLLTPVDQAWQPTDYLPDLTGDDWVENLRPFRESARQLSDEMLVVLVGNMITEEALPSYTVSLDRVVKDFTGIGSSPWAVWLRGWTAEENRHGDLLNTYLRLTGRVDMRAVEVTIHHLLRNGFTARAKGNDVAGMMYAAFQERATRISHGNVSKIAAAQGEPNLSRICRKIAGDEARHETFYTRVVGEVFERDAEEGMLAYRSVLKGIVAMPGRLMFDGKDPDIFDHFSTVTQRTGVYTIQDYAAIIAHLNDAWDIAHRSVSGKAARAQDYLCEQPDRYNRLSGEITEGIAAQAPMSFSWINGSQV